MVSTKKSAAFPRFGNEYSRYPGFLSDVPPGEVDAVDNPDGVVSAYGLGAYARGNTNNRDFSQGAGTEKGNVGNASGRGKNMKVTSGTG